MAASLRAEDVALSCNVPHLSPRDFLNGQKFVAGPPP